MLDGIFTQTPLANPLVFLVITLSICLIIFKIIKKIIKHRKNNPKSDTSCKTVTPSSKLPEDQREQAMENFKKIHAIAHDHKKKLQQEISAHPKESAQALRRMMKRQ